MFDPAIIRQQIENLRLQFPELEEDESDWLLSLESETDIDELLSKIVDQLDNVAVMSGGLAGKIAEFEVRQDRYAQQQRQLRAMALSLMQTAEIRKKELPTATLSVRKGGEKVVISDEASVPDLLCKITRTPDKTKIRALILEGAAPNWASLEQSADTLAIRTK